MKRHVPALIAMTLMLGVVLMPRGVEAQSPYENSIVDVLEAQGEYDTFVTALRSAGYDQALSSDGPYTVFAPTDEAFEAMPEGQLDLLMEDPEALAGLLGYHLVPGEYDEGALGQAATVESAFGEPLQVTTEDGEIRVSSATVISADHSADNGIVHGVDQVIMTP